MQWGNVVKILMKEKSVSTTEKLGESLIWSSVTIRYLGNVLAATAAAPRNAKRAWNVHLINSVRRDI